MSVRACESVGIDLGTTYSSLAYMDSQMMARMVADTSGNTVIPSVVYFDDAGVIVGDLALQQSKVCPERVVQFIKVHMGDKWEQTFQDHVYTPESLSAIILRNLVREAEPQIGPIKSAVITVPAWFTEKRRRATQQAGEIAGLEVIGTLNEPMAATLAFGLYRQDKEQTVVVYDLGGGTFDVTVVRISPTEIAELATNGNRQLGGRDWDQCLIDHVVDDFVKTHDLDPRGDLQAMQNLQLECELAKRRLSRMAKAPIPFHARGKDHATEVTREQFESMTSHLLQSSKLITELALEDAGLGWGQVDRVVLVGGSTHMPAVHDMLEGVTGMAPDAGVNPVVAVALGAAIYAHMVETDRAPKTILREREEVPDDEPEEKTERIGETIVEPRAEDDADEDLTIRPDEETVVDEDRDGPADADSEYPFEDDVATLVRPGDGESPSFPAVHFVTAHGVGVKVRSRNGWKNAVLIPKNEPVPARASKTFLTAAEVDGATSIKVQITQGDTTNVDLAEVLGIGRIEGFSWNEPPGQPVDVLMEFDAQGRLHINAIYVNTGQHMEMSLTIPGGLREEEVREHREHLENTNFLGVFDPGEDASDSFEVGDDYDGPARPEFDCHDALAGLDDPDDDEDDPFVDMSD